MAERLTFDEWRARLDAQGQPREHLAFVCPICCTVQSMASLRAAGVPEQKVESQLGFSCEGRWTNAGPWPTEPSFERKAHRGCDWTLGGLFRLHRLEVERDGHTYPFFEIATAEQAAQLRRDMEAAHAPN